MRGGGKLVRLLLVAGAFGVLVALIKGQNGGARDVLGNMSAPWVVVPFLAGARYASLRRAALAGLAATLAALLGFYVAEAAILDLGPHPWYVDLKLTLEAGRFYAEWGLLSGLVYGALGGFWTSRRLVAAPVAVAAAFALEPLIVLLLERAGVWGGGGLLSYPWLWVTEAAIGLGGAAFVVANAPARPRHAD